jgi:hypothetical protein
MGYYVSNIFGIRTGGVFSGKTDTDDVKERIKKLILAMRSECGVEPDMGGEDGDPSHCMSKELEAHKGSYIVLAGVFNYWRYEYSSEFARRLSLEFRTEVLHMCWDEEIDEVQCQIWLDGKQLFEVVENPIGRIMRRII